MAALLIPLSLSDVMQLLLPDTLADLISQAMRAAGQGNVDWVFVCGVISDNGNSQWAFSLLPKGERFELAVGTWA